MYKNQSISLILPCKDEAKALQPVLRSIPEIVDEVIVVDNGSSDQTVKVARRLGAKVLIDRRKDQGIGYGFAIQTGIKVSKGDILVCMDGDGSYPVSQIPVQVKKLLKTKSDFISCARLPFRQARSMSGVRALGVKILNAAIRVLFGRKIKDSLTGMWVFRSKAVPFLSLSEGGWNLSLEIKLSALLNPKIKFLESHIPYKDRVFNVSKQNIWKTGLTHLIYLFTFRIAVAKKIGFRPGFSYALRSIQSLF